MSESPFSVLSGVRLGVELLGHVVILFEFLRSCQAFPQPGTNSHPQQRCMCVQFVHILTDACYLLVFLSFLLVRDIIEGVNDSCVVLLCISLMTKSVEHLSSHVFIV